MNAMLRAPFTLAVPPVHGRQTVEIHPARVGVGGTLTLAVEDGDSLTLVYGAGGGCTLHVEGDAEAILIPLRGSVQVTGSTLVSAVHAGEALMSGPDTGIAVVGYARARWMVLVGGKSAWGWVLRGAGASQLSGAQLLPARYAASHDLRRQAIVMLRSAVEPMPASSANAFIDTVVALQAPLYAAIARCPGRTHTRRVNVFLRLQRIRRFISDRCEQELDNSVLARMANYSPCHFLSTFNHVFCETPHAYLVSERLRRAQQLLCSSDLAIEEVALVSGFKNRSAFSRLFRQRFGTTAKESRRRAHAVAKSRDGSA